MSLVDFIPNVPPLYQCSLAFELAPSDTTATLTSEVLINGNALSGLVCIAVDIGNPNPEYIIGTLSGTIFTITIRNVDPLDPTTSIGAFTSTHGQGAIVKITDFASLQIMRNILRGFQALQNPLISLSPAVNPTDVPNFSQLTAAIIGGGIPATTLLMGIARAAQAFSQILGNPTITIASPAVVTLASHGLTTGDIVVFTTTGTLPTGIVSGTSYFVISSGLTTNAFEISATLGGAAINTSGTQSGTHTLTKVTPTFLSGTASTNAALNGDAGTPGNGNKFATQTGLQDASEIYTTELSGGSTAYTATYSPAVTSLVDGMELTLKIGVTNSTTTPTFSPNGLTAHTIVKLGGVALVAGDIVVGMNRFKYDLSNTRWVLQTPVANVFGTPQYQKMSTVTFSSVSVTTSTVTTLADFTGLTGDTDDVYVMVWEFTAASSAFASQGLGLRFNADTGSNYTGVAASLGSTYAGTAVGAQSFAPIIATTGSVNAGGDVTIFAKTSGGNRTFTARTATPNNNASINLGTWLNSANQITEVTLVIQQTSGSTQTYSGLATLYKINR